MKTNIKLQIEKLRVLDRLISSIDVDKDETTSEMLRELSEQIDELLTNDF